MLNNKRIGTEFEQKMCEILSKEGWWVHFISPDNRGAQPFDIIAVRGGTPLAADCKTCDNHIFRIDRMEDNQRLAFQKWRDCGNGEPLVFVKHKNAVYCLEYAEIEQEEKIDLFKRRAMCILS